MLILPFILNRSIPFYNNKNEKKTVVNFEYAVYKKRKVHAIRTLFGFKKHKYIQIKMIIMFFEEPSKY